MSEPMTPNGYHEDRKLIFDRLGSLDKRVSRIEYGTVSILVAVLLNLLKGVV